VNLACVQNVELETGKNVAHTQLGVIKKDIPTRRFQKRQCQEMGKEGKKKTGATRKKTMGKDRERGGRQKESKFQSRPTCGGLNPYIILSTKGTKEEIRATLVGANGVGERKREKRDQRRSCQEKRRRERRSSIFISGKGKVKGKRLAKGDGGKERGNGNN